MSPDDRVTVAIRSPAYRKLTGRLLGVLCAGTDLRVGELFSDSGRPVRPNGKLDLTRGRLLVATQAASPAFRPRARSVVSPAGETASDGPARYAVTTGGTELSTGDARFNGVPLTSTGAALTCGDGAELPVIGGPPSPATSPEESPSPSGTRQPRSLRFHRVEVGAPGRP